MTKATLPPTEETKKCESMPPAPAPMPEDSDTLDWDGSIEIPPPHRIGTIRVTLEYAGRGQPMAVPDPDSNG